MDILLAIADKAEIMLLSLGLKYSLYNSLALVYILLPKAMSKLLIMQHYLLQSHHTNALVKKVYLIINRANTMLKPLHK